MILANKHHTWLRTIADQCEDPPLQVADSSSRLAGGAASSPPLSMGAGGIPIIPILAN